MPSRRLPLALAASICLHAALLVVGLPLGERVTSRTDAPASIDAMLLAPPAPDRLLKDTLADMDHPATAEPTPTPTAAGRKSVAAARRQLADHVYYPPEAIRQGMEGEVRLLLTLAGDGRIVDAVVAAGSGHELLDQAALRAARALGRLRDVDRREIILPVVFRLAP